ncbi:hypothetical protein L9G15_23065, partial [Shewanella sp. A3A]|nr:hypothetical protein [Shewanella ferrihydritica]
EPGAAGTPGKAWETPRANVVKSSRSVLEDVVANSREHPLANPRMHLHQGGLTDESLVDSLSSPAGCRMAAAHLMVDGAFNINSTDVEAWTA